MSDGGYVLPRAIVDGLKRMFTEGRGWAQGNAVVIDAGEQGMEPDKRRCRKCGVMKYHHKGPDFEDHYFERPPERDAKPVGIELLNSAYATELSWEGNRYGQKSFKLKVKVTTPLHAFEDWGKYRQSDYVFEVPVSEESYQQVHEMFNRGRRLKLVLMEE